MSTPHIRAQKGDIAPRILLPGDPLRAKYIAETFLTNPVLVNDVRGMFGYTGSYKGVAVSVMGTGMGVPSISIYVTELLDVYGVKTLIRVGTCGSYKEDIGLKELIFGIGACTDTGFLRHIFPGDYAPIADFSLLLAAYEKAAAQGIRAHVGLLKTSDMFYTEPGVWGAANWGKYGVLGVEMEAAALYAIAAKHGARALAMCTVSDSLHAANELTSDERERALDAMIRVALETACAQTAE